MNRSRIARWFPVWALACTMSRKAARAGAEARRLRHEVAVLRSQVAALEGHFRLAVDQRERARDLAAALAAQPSPSWDDAEFEAFVRSLGEGRA